MQMKGSVDSQNKAEKKSQPQTTSKDNDIDPNKYEDLLSKISIHRGSITDMDVDCIVNAANSGLWGGAGVCGAIFDAAGSNRLEKECNEIIDKFGRIPDGQSVITKGYKLRAKHIIHSVGPMTQKDDALQSCYITALDLCILHNVKSIAFPCISTGIFGFNRTRAASIALQTVRNWLMAAKETKYKDYIKLLKKRETLRMQEAMKRQKKEKKKWKSIKSSKEDKEEKDTHQNDKDGDANEKQSKKDEDNGSDDSDVNKLTVFDRINDIVFCCYDRANWMEYEQSTPKIYPSSNADHSYLWADKMNNKKQQTQFKSKV